MYRLGKTSRRKVRTLVPTWSAPVPCNCGGRTHTRAPPREPLRTAYQMLDAMGIGAFAERARRELLATGEAARKRTVETAVALTAQEAQVAQLARDGRSGRDSRCGYRDGAAPGSAGRAEPSWPRELMPACWPSAWRERPNIPTWWPSTCPASVIPSATTRCRRRGDGEFVIRAAGAFGLDHPHRVEFGQADPRQIVASALTPASSGTCFLTRPRGLPDQLPGQPLRRVDALRARLPGRTSRSCAACCRRSARRCRSSPARMTRWCHRPMPSSYDRAATPQQARHRRRGSLHLGGRRGRIRRPHHQLVGRWLQSQTENNRKSLNSQNGGKSRMS